MEVSLTVQPNILSNSTITNNIALTLDQVYEYADQEFIKDSFRQELQQRNELLEPAPRAIAIELLSGTLSIQNWTVFTKQDNVLSSMYSTLEIDQLYITKTDISFV